MRGMECVSRNNFDNGTEQVYYRFKPQTEDVALSAAAGAGVAGTGFIIGMSMGFDPFATILSLSALGTAVTGGLFRGMSYSSIKGNVSLFSGADEVTPKFNQLRRTLKEKRFPILAGKRSADGKTKISREIVTNRHGIWMEETIIPIATTAVQVKSWDAVLDQVIQVHGLENIDKIASKTIPALSADGQKVSWKNTVGNLLEDIGVHICPGQSCPHGCRRY